MFRFLPLILANLRRRKFYTIFTLASAGCALAPDLFQFLAMLKPVASALAKRSP